MQENTQKKRAKSAAKAKDPLELIIANKAEPGKLFLPQAVKRSVVTMEEVSTILQELPVHTDIEQRISKDKKSAPTKISLSDEVLESGVVTGPLSPTTRAVLEATLSQLMAGNHSFTSAMLYRTMTGRSTSESVTAEQQMMVDEAMNQLMFTPLHIDLKMYSENGDVEGDGQLRGPIVPAEQITMNIAGNTCTAYQITNLPIIYRFCMATNSLTMTPISLLSIGDMSYTKRNLAILNTLQRRIAPIIYPVAAIYQKPAPLTIPYESIYEVAEEDTGKALSPVQKKRIRETVSKILNAWVDGKYLSKWEDLKQGNEIYACKLHFPKNGPPELPEVPPISSKSLQKAIQG